MRRGKTKRLWWFVLALSCGPGAAMAEGAAPAPITVPSGQAISWVETLRDTQGPSGLTLRFRFLAPGLGGAEAVPADRLEDDMLALCNDFARPRVPSTGPQPAQIVISLSNRVIPFGTTDETVAQVFDAYSIVDGACSWDMF